MYAIADTNDGKILSGETAMATLIIAKGRRHKLHALRNSQVIFSIERIGCCIRAARNTYCAYNRACGRMANCGNKNRENLEAYAKETYSAAKEIRAIFIVEEREIIGAGK